MSYAIEVQIDDEFDHEINSQALEQVAELTLRACQIERGSLTIVVTDDEQVRTLNREFRAVDAATDVLSFPNEEDEDESVPQLALPAELEDENEQYLGDIIIAYPYSMAQAKRYGNSPLAELRLLTVHGVLHLLGFDHATPEEEQEMWQQQSQILQTFGDPIDLSQRVYDE